MQLYKFVYMCILKCNSRKEKMLDISVKQEYFSNISPGRRCKTLRIAGSPIRDRNKHALSSDGTKDINGKQMYKI